MALHSTAQCLRYRSSQQIKMKFDVSCARYYYCHVLMSLEEYAKIQVCLLCDKSCLDYTASGPSFNPA
jgi:hypothetical protein